MSAGSQAVHIAQGAGGRTQSLPACPEALAALSARSVALRDPWSGAEDGALLALSGVQLWARAHALRSAQPAWAALGAARRGEALRALADSLEEERGALISALTRDTGRIIESEIELAGVLSALRRWADKAPALLAAAEEPRPSEVTPFELSGQLVPYPLVGVISPWNFPLLLTLIDAIPALAAGCAVLLKPSEVTPRAAEQLIALLQRHRTLAPVVGLALGDGAVGAALIPLVDTLCFTGSVETGERVARAAAEAFIPAHLELGGKDPALVLPGAELPAAASAIARAGMINAGQSCLSIERVIVHETIAEPFLELLQRELKQLQPNHEQISEGQLGPLIWAPQAVKLRQQIDDALERGATLRCGGELIEAGGLWCQATLLDQVPADAAVIREESFGPLLAVQRARDVEEAIRLANDSDFGLSAAVFGAPEEARSVARRLAAGAVSINDAGLTAFVHDGEKQSFRRSGLGGSRMGAASLQRFYRKKLLIERSPR